MRSETLKLIHNLLTGIGINYQFMRWESDPVYPYLVGEYTEEEPQTEDGLRQSVFTLTGFHRGTWLELQIVKNKIEELFDPIYGHRAKLPDGSQVVIFYSRAFGIPIEEMELKRMQIDLIIKEWRN